MHTSSIILVCLDGQCIYAFSSFINCENNISNETSESCNDQTFVLDFSMRNTVNEHDFRSIVQNDSNELKMQNRKRYIGNGNISINEIRNKQRLLISGNKPNEKRERMRNRPFSKLQRFVRSAINPSSNGMK